MELKARRFLTRFRNVGASRVHSEIDHWTGGDEQLIQSVFSIAACDSGLKPLLKNGNAFVCRGQLGAEGLAASVLAVIPASDAPARSFLDRLHHEYELKCALEPDWAARPLRLVQGGDRALLLLEDPGGRPKRYPGFLHSNSLAICRLFFRIFSTRPPSSCS
jgi:hypothetical protein